MAGLDHGLSNRERAENEKTFSHGCHVLQVEGSEGGLRLPGAGLKQGFQGEGAPGSPSGREATNVVSPDARENSGLVIVESVDKFNELDNPG